MTDVFLIGKTIMEVELHSIRHTTEFLQIKQKCIDNIMLHIAQLIINTCLMCTQYASKLTCHDVLIIY